MRKTHERSTSVVGSFIQRLPTETPTEVLAAYAKKSPAKTSNASSATWKATSSRPTRWDALELADKRRLIRAVVAPVVNRIERRWDGRTGANRERVDPVWR